LQQFSDFFPTRVFFGGAILSSHYKNLQCGASILHHIGGLHKFWDGLRLDDIYTILDGIKNHPMEYDDQIVRQLLECIVVDSKEQVTVIFKGGLKSVQPLTE
ncbi:MAG: hypothetical protein PUG24_01500, partial [Eubacteriales bacterium]|nr:hypothetical protein [Eubacteriales bacterium]